MNKTTLYWMGLVILFASALALALCIHPLMAHALDEGTYTPGEDYRIDDPEAFRDQDIDHGEAVESSGSTGYYLTSPFYLNWVSPDVVIYENESAYIGCQATGLKELRYQWYVSADGGKTYADAHLAGSEHTLSGDDLMGPSEIPYLYRCVITNGDGLSELTTEVSVTILSVGQQAPSSSIDGSIPQTGDNLWMLVMCLGTAAVLSGGVLVLAYRSQRRSHGIEAPKGFTRR